MKNSEAFKTSTFIDSDLSHEGLPVIFNALLIL